MKIYTKTGDLGETGLLNSRRVSKSHDLIEALGSIDESVSMLGLTSLNLLTGGFPAESQALVKIQKTLFYLGAFVAREGQTEEPWPNELTQDLERQIDHWEAHLPTLKNFILPGGEPLSAQIHHTRNVIRRMERWLVAVLQGTPAQATLAYVNRLSDFLFMMARWISHQKQTPEITIRPNAGLLESLIESVPAKNPAGHDKN
ncbi:MAG: cob(I)yrinic acid a,c-diamide adenosyltransferase [Elusimicrobia bacterium]|nr:cob(I)yrinic acid a,c-diamide adenosyltransferase [Elusimicrobiota bacterium]